MEEIKIEKIIRSRRKTIALEVTDMATLIVKAPYFVSEKAIKDVINRHSKWIEKKITYAKQLQRVEKKQFVSGESFFYLGGEYTLFVVKEQKESLKFDNGFFLKEESKPFAEEIFRKWYKKRAREFINQRVLMYANLAGIKFNKIRITSAKKRWGSCSRENNLSFSYRLIMAPLPVVDYVVVHELCHIVEHNHSKAFWGKVKVILPEYKEAREWLKEKGQTLVI